MLSIADADYTLLGDGQDDELGTVVAFVGDMDGDGLDDISCTAPGAETAYVVLGARLDAISPGTAASTLTNLYEDTDAVLTGPHHAVTSAGDLNDDGLGDLLVEAGPASGVAYVLSPY